MTSRPRAACLGALVVFCASSSAQEPGAWVVLEPTAMVSRGGAELVLQPEGSILVRGIEPEEDVYELEFETGLEGISALRLEALPHHTLSANGPGRASNGNFVLSELRLSESSKHGRPELVRLVASADHSQRGWPVAAAVDGLEATGWAILPEAGAPSTAVFETARDVGHSTGKVLRLELAFLWGQAHALGHFRLSATTAARPVFVEPEWAGMQPRIDAAIDAGVAYLISEQQLDGSWSFRQAEYESGQTALTVYTLLKQGVPPEHPAIRRGVEFLRAHPPARTYSAGCQLLAIWALDDPENLEWAAEIADRLVSWQRGGFAYPDHAVDISNTQYGALGLWAARNAGVPVPGRVWQVLAEHTLRHQEPPGEDGAAGFTYHEEGLVTGSRTAAGVGILAICESALDAIAARPFAAARERGMRWLAKHFAADANPGEGLGDPWIYYYLYGIERVGGLTGVQRIGGSDWYREGVRFLVGAQSADGRWTDGGDAEPNTCFALLFLSRATSPASGESARRGRVTFGADDPARDVSVRASGAGPLAIWISSFGDRALGEVEWPGESGHGPHVAKVEYLLAGPARTAEAWADSTWRYTTRKPGADWNRRGFHDASWFPAEGPFGNGAAPGDDSAAGPEFRTEWTERELWLRRELTVDPYRIVEPLLRVHHSDARSRAGGGALEASAKRDPGPTLEVYVNGEPLYRGDDRDAGYRTLAEGAALARLVEPGRNVLAARVVRTGPGQVVDVELLDRPILAAVPGDPSEPCGAQRFAAKLDFERPGTCEILTRVHVVVKDERTGRVEPRVLEAPPMDVFVELGFDRDLLTYAGDAARDVVPAPGTEVVGSSELEGWEAALAVDRLLARGWLCADDDPRPSLTLRFERPVRANTLLLTHAPASRLGAERTARARRVAVRFDGKGTAYEIELVPDDGRKTIWSFPKTWKLRSLEITVLDRTQGPPELGAVGFAEVELQLRK